MKIKRHNQHLTAAVTGFCVIATFALSSAATQVYKVRPSVTDTAITQYNYQHHAFINKSVPSKNKLFLFFSGTGGVPAVYQMVCRKASDLGYHAIGLTYPNDLSINNDICVSGTDISCYETSRKEVLTGTDHSPYIQVDRTNSAENRLIRLLQYLNSTYPSDNWGLYLDGTGQIQWEHVIVAGHSQGGGMATMTGTMHAVSRVIIFDWTDWRGVGPAPWIVNNGPTPPANFYGFTHVRDPMVNINIEMFTWRVLGMDTFGDSINTDMHTAPYGGSHMLVTNIDSADYPGSGASGSYYHGVTVSDLCTPLNPDSSALFGPAWEYLIDSAPQTRITGLPDISPETHADITVSLWGRMLVVTSPAAPLRKVEAFSVNGQKLFSALSHSNRQECRLTYLQPGLLLVRIWTAQGYVVKKIRGIGAFSR
jgi:hypothetical protein